MLVLALLFHSSFPARENLQWAVAAGLFGGFALAVFYRALSQGNMGLTAPVSAVLGAGIPTAFGFFTQGFPGTMQIAGFLLAGIGIWLISRSEGVVGRPKGIGTAMVAGFGFAGYFLCIHQAGDASVFWLAGTSRFVSLLTTGAIVLATRQFGPMDSRGSDVGAGSRCARHQRQCAVHRCQPAGTARRCGCDQFAVSRDHSVVGAYLSARAFFALENRRHDRGVSGGADDCGMRRFVILKNGIQMIVMGLNCKLPITKLQMTQSPNFPITHCFHASD